MGVAALGMDLFPGQSLRICHDTVWKQ
jgi:hypothetical protein